MRKQDKKLVQRLEALGYVEITIERNASNREIFSGLAKGPGVQCIVATGATWSSCLRRMMQKLNEFTQ